MTPVRIRGKLIERYATIIALLTLFVLSYTFWTWGRVSKSSTAMYNVAKPEFAGSVPKVTPPLQAAEQHDQPAPEVLALPEVEKKSDDGFIPVPEDGVVPAGSSVRLDMTTGERMYKPPQVIDDVRDHRDYVDMSALRELHKRTGGVPKEQTKWKQQFKGARKQIEDLLISLKPTVASEAALKTIEQLEDYVISTMSNAGGIFHSDHFLNLVGMLEHEKIEVRLATASLMFYSLQNNHLTSAALLGNEKALTVLSRTLSVEKDFNVLYKCVSILDSAIAVCVNDERIREYISTLKKLDLFTLMANRIDSLGNTAGPEKVLSTLALVARKTEDESCVQLMEVAVGKASTLPKTLINKLVTPICSLVNVKRHPTLSKQCRSN